MLQGYKFTPSETGAPAHVLQTGDFRVSIVVHEQVAIVTTIRNGGPGPIEVSSYLVDRSEPARWAQLARTAERTTRLTLPVENSVLHGEPCLVIAPGTNGGPAVVMFTDRRWAHANGQHDGLKASANLVEHIGCRVDLNKVFQGRA